MKTSIKTRTEKRLSLTPWNICETIDKLREQGYKSYSRKHQRRIPECKEVLRVYLATGGGVYVRRYELKAVLYR